MNKTEWIKTSDRLPEMYEAVLITFKRRFSETPKVGYAYRKPYGNVKKAGSIRSKQRLRD